VQHRLVLHMDMLLLGKWRICFLPQTFGNPVSFGMVSVQSLYDCADGERSRTPVESRTQSIELPVCNAFSFHAFKPVTDSNPSVFKNSDCSTSAAVLNAEYGKYRVVIDCFCHEV